MKNQVEFVPLEKCRINRYQIEGIREQEKIDEIKQSVKEHQDNGSLGLIQFPIARKMPDGTYELVFGRHRFWSFEELYAEGNKEFGVIPLIVRELSNIEMHELMGIEMLQHRTVSAIEEAKLFDDYMTIHGKNSVQCADKFGKTDEYVRQSVRLLNLPPSVQVLIQEGELNKTQGRQLLALKRIRDDEAIEKTVKAFLTYENGDFDEALEHSLLMGNAEFLDSSEKWFAMGKSFPHKHLGKVNLDGKLVFLKDVKAKEQERVIGELLTLFASGMEVTQDAFGGWLTERCIEELRVLQAPPACSSCPFMATVKGHSYCGFKPCLTRKKEAWEKHEIEKEAEALGVPMYTKADGKYLALDYYNTAHVKVWNSGSADLRLMTAKNQHANFEGVGSRLKVVVVGAMAEKLLKKQENSKEQNQADGGEEAENPQVRKDQLRMREQAMLKFAWEVAAFSFSKAVEGITSVGLLEFICLDLYINPDFQNDFDANEWVADVRKMKSSEKLKQLRRLFAYKLIEVGVDIYPLIDSKTAILKYCDALVKFAEKIELKLPKDLRKQAEKYQAELDVALKEVR